MEPRDPATGETPTVLRLCSVFELPPGVTPRRRFDPIGGMQTHTGELSSRLDRLGVPQHILSTRPPGASKRERLGVCCVIHRVGVSVPFARQLYAVPALPLAARLARDASVIHAHLGEDLAVLPIALSSATRFRLPLVITVHSSLRHTLASLDLRTTLLRRLGGRIEAFVERRADAVIVLTPRLEALLRADGVRPSCLHLIPPGVNRPLFSGPFADPLPGVGRPRVLFVGRMSTQKGLQTLISAFPLLRTAGVQLVVAGDGPLRGSIERQIAKAARRNRLDPRTRISAPRCGPGSARARGRARPALPLRRVGLDIAGIHASGPPRGRLPHRRDTGGRHRWGERIAGSSRRCARAGSLD